MEGFHGSIGNGGGNYSKAPKIKVPPGMKMQQLMIRSSRHHGNPLSSTTFDSYSENLDLNAPLLRYMCSGSPVGEKPALAEDGGFVPRGSLSRLLAVENLIERSPPPPLVYGTPAKVVEGEETVDRRASSERRRKGASELLRLRFVLCVGFVREESVQDGELPLLKRFWKLRIQL